MGIMGLISTLIHKITITTIIITPFTHNIISLLIITIIIITIKMGVAITRRISAKMKINLKMPMTELEDHLGIYSGPY